MRFALVIPFMIAMYSFSVAGDIPTDADIAAGIAATEMPVQEHIPDVGEVASVTTWISSYSTPGPIKKRTFIKEQPKPEPVPFIEVGPTVWGTIGIYVIAGVLIIGGIVITHVVKKYQKRKLADPMQETDDDLELQIDNKLLRKHRADHGIDDKTRV